jgi:hypothetical protein
MRDSLTPHIRLVDGSPADVLRSNGIGISSERARYTSESVPTRAVALVYSSTLRARLRGIAGFNEPYGYPGEPRFVFHKLPELIKDPGVHRPPLRLSNRDPRPYPFEVLKRDTTLRALSLADDELRDYVVDIASHPPLFATAFLQEPLGTVGSTSLQLSPDMSIAVSEALQMRARINLAVGVRSDVFDPEINPKPALRNSRRWLLDVDRGKQIPLTVPVEQVALTLSRLEHLLCTFIANKRDTFSPTNSPDRHRLTEISKDAVVIGDGAEVSKGAFASLVQFVCISYFGDSPHRHLSGKTKTKPNFVVSELMQFVLRKRSPLPRYFANCISCLVRASKRFLERLGLLIGRKELYLNRQSHALVILSDSEHRKTKKSLHCRLKQLVSVPAFP